MMGGGGGGAGAVAQLVALEASASINGPDEYARRLAALNDLELEVEAILHV